MTTFLSDNRMSISPDDLPEDQPHGLVGTCRGQVFERGPVHGVWQGAYVIDPITGLVAFPSFMSTFPLLFRGLLNTYGSLGMAIGDVDNLKSYVESRNHSDPHIFGHLAGNAFMANVGRISLSVFERMPFPWKCVATFGGDEVILACAGTSRSVFASCVNDLSHTLSNNLPRTVSFAHGWFSVSADARQPTLTDDDSSFLCMSILAQVDRALFASKKRRRDHKNIRSSKITSMRVRWLSNREWKVGGERYDSA